MDGSEGTVLPRYRRLRFLSLERPIKAQLTGGVLASRPGLNPQNKRAGSAGMSYVFGRCTPRLATGLSSRHLLTPRGEMSVENRFQLLAVPFLDANPRRRQESEPSGDMQAKNSLRRAGKREGYEFARNRRSLPLVAFNIEPRDQPSMMENSTIPYLEIRSND